MDSNKKCMFLSQLPVVVFMKFVLSLLRSISWNAWLFWLVPRYTDCTNTLMVINREPVIKKIYNFHKEKTTRKCLRLKYTKSRKKYVNERSQKKTTFFQFFFPFWFKIWSAGLRTEKSTNSGLRDQRAVCPYNWTRGLLAHSSCGLPEGCLPNRRTCIRQNMVCYVIC